MRRYLVNVLSDPELPLIDEPLPFGGGVEVPVGDDGVRVLYGDAEAVTCLVAADDEHDAERRVIATWGDTVTIDDLREVPSVAYEAGGADLEVPLATGAAMLLADLLSHDADMLGVLVPDIDMDVVARIRATLAEALAEG